MKISNYLFPYPAIFVILCLIATVPCALTAQQTSHSDDVEPFQPDQEQIYQKYLQFSSKVHGGIVEPQWLDDGNRFWFTDGEPDSLVIWKVDPIRQTKTEFFDVARLRAVLAEALDKDPPGRGVPFRRISIDEEEGTARFRLNDRDIVLDLETYEVSLPPREVDEEVADPEVIREFEGVRRPLREVASNRGDWFATIHDRNLWIRSPATNDSIQLTEDGIEDCEWGLVLPVLSDEWAHWSPDDRYLAVRKTDHRDMPKIPVVDWLEDLGTVSWAYPNHLGHSSRAVAELHIVDVEARHVVQVKTRSDPGTKMHVFGWLPDGSELILGTLDRAWREFKLLAADPATGKARHLLTETTDTFVFDWWFQIPYWMEMIGYFTLLEDGEGFIWMSERSGMWQLYLYDIDGTEIRRLTDHPFPVMNVEAFDHQRGWVYYRAFGDAERPYDAHLFRVHLDGGDPERLTDKGASHHAFHFAPSTEYFITSRSTVNRPPVAELRTADGTRLMTLSEADITAMEEIGWHPPEEFSVKAADGETDLYGVLFKPHDFDPVKRYPVIEINYAYPFSSAVPHTFPLTSATNRWQALAQLGYVVVMLDARGTPWRGKDFMDAVYGNLGRVELADHVAALEQLEDERPYMDMSRVGITGGSGGAWFAIRALLKAPDVYHVGVARAPGDFYGMLRDNDVSPYLGPPEENPEAYEYASNITFADRLEGELLIAIGTADVNTPFSITMQLVDAFIRADKQIGLLVLPGEAHGASPQHRQYVEDAKRRHFELHLKGRLDNQNSK